MQQPRISIAPDAGSGELPFVIGVMADLTGMPQEPLPRFRDRRFVDVNRDNLDEVLEACRPHLAFAVENRLSEDPDAGPIKVDLHFQSLEDFSPHRVLLQIKPLRELMELRTRLAELNATLRNQEGLGERLKEAAKDPAALEQLREELWGEGEAPPPPVPQRRNWVQAAPAPPEPGVWSRGRTADDPSALNRLVEGFRTPSPEQRERTRDHAKEFIKQVLTGSMMVSRDAESMVSARIAQIDHLLSLQLNEVLHDVEFQKLEATWRGLHFLLRRIRKAQRVKVRVLNISKKELAQQFDNARERHDSAVSRKLINRAGTPGAEPYTLLLGAYEVQRHDSDLFLRDVARLAEYVNAPFLAAASPEMLTVESFPLLAERDLQQLESSRNRARLESRYIGLVLPRFLLRAPYTKENSPKEFVLEEGVDGTDRNKYLWGNAVWALAAHLANIFHTYGWLGAAREPAQIAGLPVTSHYTDEGDITSHGPTELAIPDRLYAWLRECGFIPFCAIEGTDAATFHEMWSTHRPVADPDGDPPTTYESAQIDCMLDLCRFAHTIRAILHRERQTFETAQACEDRLRAWLSQYVAPAYARGRTAECAWPLLSADLHIASTPDGKSTLHAALLPFRAAGAIAHPVEFEIPIVLPWALTQAPTPLPAAGLPEPEETTGRDRFMRRIQQAEAAIQLRKFDVAILILEDLAAVIDRHQLEEWESPHLITRVWDLLRRCYLFTATDPGDRQRALLGRICRLDPTRAIE